VKHYPAFIILLAGLLSITSCAPARFVKPLKEGETTVTASGGGPIVYFFPLPFSNVTVGHGLTNATTVFGSINTSSLFFGDIQLEAGASTLLLGNKHEAGLTVTPILNAMMDVWENNVRVWPQVDLHLFNTYNRAGDYYYGTISNWFEIPSQKAHGEAQKNHWFLSTGIGHVSKFKVLDLTLEVKYHAIGIDNSNRVLDYVGVNGKGTLGFYAALAYSFK